MDLYAKRTSLIDTENAFRIGPHIAYLKSKGFNVCQLNLGDPDFDVPTHIKQEIKKQLVGESVMLFFLPLKKPTFLKT